METLCKITNSMKFELKLQMDTYTNDNFLIIDVQCSTALYQSNLAKLVCTKQNTKLRQQQIRYFMKKIIRNLKENNNKKNINMILVKTSKLTNKLTLYYLKKHIL